MAHHPVDTKINSWVSFYAASLEFTSTSSTFLLRSTIHTATWILRLCAVVYYKMCSKDDWVQWCSKGLGVQGVQAKPKNLKRFVQSFNYDE